MKKSGYRDYFTLIVCLVSAVFLVGAFTGQWPWVSSDYNSYVLQAQSWLSGRLDLGRDYSWLEIATYEGKYYISFPPFPSYIMLPFVAIFGTAFKSGIIAFASFIFAGIYCMKIAKHFQMEKEAVLYALLATVCSNYFFIGINDWVWFIAQNLCFTLCVMSIYYALTGKGAVSFILWACAVGCRPFTIMYLPALIIICYKNTKINKNLFIVKLVKWSVVPVLIGISYMTLNFLRFDNPLEFGHNYLPEFIEAPQFSLSYAFTNVLSLIRLPELTAKGFSFPEFNGMNMFVASPIFIIGAVAAVKGIIKGDITIVTAIIAICVELILILCHKTMGGSHYGNRYTVDLIPLVFYMIAVRKPSNTELCYIPSIIGFGLNLGWIIKYFS